MMLAVGAAFLPVLFFFRSQFEANTGGFQEAGTLAEGLRTLWHHVITYVLPAGVFPDGDGSLPIVIRLALVRMGIVILIIAGIFRRRDLTGRTLAFAAIAMATACCFLAAYFAVGPQYFELRHASVLFVPILLFLTSFLTDIFSRDDVLPGRFGNYLVPAVGLLVLISFSFSLLTLYPEMAKRGDWARVGEFIGQNEKPGQPILVFTVFDAMALPYQYHGVNRILPEERFLDFDNEAEYGSQDSLAQQTGYLISTIPPDAAEIWLVVNEKCAVTKACVPLEKFVEANYTVIQEKEFYKEKVRLLRKMPQ
jgi:hypothetical protein